MVGTAVLIVALAGGLGAVWSYYQAANGRSDLLKFGRAGLYLSGAGIVVACALLMSAILLHDFSLAYVWSYSDRSLPLHFLISTFYAGQEGSFLFWALCSIL